MVEEAAPIYLHDDALFWARKYCDRGWRVVPLHGLQEDGKSCTCSRGEDCGKSAGKHPIYKSWATRATHEFASVEGDLKGRRNVGLAMGAGYVAVDVDGDDGRRSLKKLCEEHPDWPDGPVAETGSGGLHFLFKTKECFKNSVKIVDGIDIRSEGGQIVACPSLHRSGRRYRWLPQDMEQPDGPSTFDLEVPELPEWLASILRGTAHLEFDIGGWLAEQDPAVSGENGSRVLMRIAHKCVRAGMCRTFSRFTDVIAPWNARCDPPWNDKELLHAYENAFGKYKTEAAIELPIDKNGQVICSRVHVDMIVRADPRYEGQFRFNKRTMDHCFRDEVLTEEEVTRIEVEICDRYRLRSINKQWLRDSIYACGEESAFDPVVDYLKGLKWDGVKRIAEVPARYMNAKESPLTAAMFKRWMIGAASRALTPGVQMDNVLILWGPQGYRKSSFFRAMAGGWHVDTALDLTNKDVYLMLHRAWLMEWSELASIAKLDNERVKAFISSTEDNFRPPYGRTQHLQAAERRDRGLDEQAQLPQRPHRAPPLLDHRVEAPIDVDGDHARCSDQLWAEAVVLARASSTTSPRTKRRRAPSTRGVHAGGSDLPGHARPGGRRDGDQQAWTSVCAYVGLRSDISGRQRDSVTTALYDCGLPERADDGRRGRQARAKWMWDRVPRVQVE
jgi:hypothetical protein